MSIVAAAARCLTIGRKAAHDCYEEADTYYWRLGMVVDAAVVVLEAPAAGRHLGLNCPDKPVVAVSGCCTLQPFETREGPGVSLPTGD